MWRRRILLIGLCAACGGEPEAAPERAEARALRRACLELAAAHQLDPGGADAVRALAEAELGIGGARAKFAAAARLLRAARDRLVATANAKAAALAAKRSADELAAEYAEVFRPGTQAAPPAWDAGREVAQAAEHLLAAGDYAEARAGFDEARDLCLRALGRAETYVRAYGSGVAAREALETALGELADLSARTARLGVPRPGVLAQGRKALAAGRVRFDDGAFAAAHATWDGAARRAREGVQAHRAFLDAHMRASAERQALVAGLKQVDEHVDALREPTAAHAALRKALRLGDVHLEAGRPDDALAAFAAGMKRHPHALREARALAADAETRARAAQRDAAALFARLEEFEFEALRQRLARDSGFAEARREFVLAETLLQQGRFAPAADGFAEAARLLRPLRERFAAETLVLACEQARRAAVEIRERYEPLKPEGSGDHEAAERALLRAQRLQADERFREARHAYADAERAYGELVRRRAPARDACAKARARVLGLATRFGETFAPLAANGVATPAGVAEAAEAVAEAATHFDERRFAAAAELYAAAAATYRESVAFFEAVRRDAKRAGALHEAAAGGDADRIALLLAAGARPAARDADGNTALHATANADAARLLLGQARARNRALQTALHTVPSADVAEVLLEAGLPVDQPDARGRTPLHVAAAHGWRAKAAALLWHEADPRAVTRTLPAAAGEGPVQPAARVDDPESAWTPLHYAARAGDVALVRLLREHGADPAAKDAGGRTPADVAASDAVRDALSAR